MLAILSCLCILGNTVLLVYILIISKDTDLFLKLSTALSSFLFMGSEILGSSKCKSNSILQLIRQDIGQLKTGFHITVLPHNPSEQTENIEETPPRHIVV